MVEEAPRMTGQELAVCLDILRWSGRTLAREIGWDQKMVVRWLSGLGWVPPDVAVWLRKLADFHRANPFPRQPKRIRGRRAITRL